MVKYLYHLFCQPRIPLNESHGMCNAYTYLISGGYK